MNKPTLLAIDCASVPASVALLRGGETAFEAAHRDAARTDAWLATALDECFATSNTDLDELDGLVVTVGPGAFTGIRVGIATCLGLSAPRGLPVCGVQTLEALAESGHAQSALIACCVDARRGQVYGAIFRLDTPPTLPMSPEWGPEVCAPAHFAAVVTATEGALVIGSGAPLLGAPGDSCAAETSVYLAAAAGRLAARTWQAGDNSPAEWPSPEPFYIRPPDATPPKSPLLAGR